MGRAFGRSSTEARSAIAAFVDGNAHRLQHWLDVVAAGVPRLSPSGEQMRDGDGNPLWVVPPNPEKAFNLFQSVVEYHVPKLARTEMTGANGGAITVASLDLKHLSDIELAQVSQLLLKADRNEPNVVDVTPG